MKFSIGRRTLGHGQPIFIIAEIARTYGNNLKTAMEMIKIAADIGVDAIKIQSIDPSELLVKNSTTISHYKKLESLKRSREEHILLFQAAHKYGIEFLSTPESLSMINLLEEIEIPAYKIASLDIVYEKLLKYAASKNKPMLVSCGMATEEEVKRAYQLIQSQGNEKICFLHCTSLYPTPYDKANVRKISTLQSMFPNLPIGYSDHTIGITASVLSVGLGVRVIEKHFTLDRSQIGADHLVACDVPMLTSLVKSVREAEALMTGNSFLTDDEYSMRAIKRRKLVASQNMAAGKILNEDSIDAKQNDSSLGIESGKIGSLIGKKLVKSLRKDDLITNEDIH